MGDLHFDADVYFDAKIETLPRDQLRKLQDHRLRWQFRRCWDGSEWYRARFEAAGLSPETFGGLADLDRLPLLTADELARMKVSAWRVAQSGWITATTGDITPVVRKYTEGDLMHERDRGARGRWAAGVQEPKLELPDELLPYYLSVGFRRNGPPGVSPERQLLFHPFSHRILGYTVAFSCSEQHGRHLADDHLLAEILHPRTGARAPDGTLGELVVSDLVREASPLIRFRTGLKRIVTHTECACGRTSSLIWTAEQFRKAKLA